MLCRNLSLGEMSRASDLALYTIQNLCHVPTIVNQKLISVSSRANLKLREKNTKIFEKE